MNDKKIEIIQKVHGSQATVAGIQNIYNGYTLSDAIEIAFAVSRDNLHILRQEALQMLEQMLNERLKSVPLENIVQPSPGIAISILQNESVTEDVMIREMYANLLASSMNSVVKEGVHPSFVEIIKQISPDEAKILNYFCKKHSVPIIDFSLQKENSISIINIVKDFSNIGELVNCEYPFHINTYFNNLVRLGLLEKRLDAALTNKTLYEPLKKHPFIQSEKEKAIKSGQYSEQKYTIPHFSEHHIYLSNFGKMFCKICMGN